MNDVIEKIKTELSVFEEKKIALVNELRQEFPKIMQPLFEQSKKIDSFSWTQYTPYFNDGDECYFGVNDVDEVNGAHIYDCKFLEKEIGPWAARTPNPDYDAYEFGIYTEIADIISSIPEDFLKDLFGDHVQVTVNRDGTISVETYEHD